MHPLCNFLQVMTAKEFESLMNGPALIDRGKSLDLSSGQGDSSIPSPATSPRSFGTPVNHNLKKGDRVRFFGDELCPGLPTSRFDSYDISDGGSC
jgi:hypothetical protein